ncbi:hypothetical protein [Bradyrhizobium sp. SEMIA]|uniref:hypothetical protein n=1 Tax=Bradyrhizobium sp. SEMIA TaxID=2597515 RepID=UPI0018A6A5EB|nr:hypothetical protein [Bradyrhizobium sp. SEMIA]QOG22138.1 hypothetical protein FOM02_37430 [Bradyrhizobium sp. SEMIA]
MTKNCPLPWTRADLLAAGLVATFVGILGLWPHLQFAWEIGEFRYFHGAYDEDTYVLSWLLGTLRSTRALSGFALSIIYRLCGSSLDATLAASDFVFPFLASCAAYFAVSQVVSGRSARVLAALLLVFANDLFSLGNLILWTSGQFNILRFSQIVGLAHPNLVPSYETSFLAILRTPEPQVSFVLMFLTLGLLARFAVVIGIRERAALAAAVITISLLPIGYTFVTLPVAAIAGGFLLVQGYFRQISAIPIAVGLLGAALVSLSAVYWDHNGGQTTTGMLTGLTYPTRLPIITPSVIGSLVFSISFACWMIWRGCREPLAFLALGCLVMPLVLSNQQIVTGVMFSARDWERTVSYPVLLFGAVTALSVMAPSYTTRLSFPAPVLWVCSALIVAVVVRAEKTSFSIWRAYNMEAIATVRALQAVDAATADQATLVLDNAGIAPVLQVRTNNRYNVVLTFYRVAMDFIPNMAPEARSADPSRYENELFEHWFRTEVSPEMAEQLLRAEIQQRAGSNLSYLFSFRDAWYPASDNRTVRQAELEQSVGPIIERYRGYLSSPARCKVFERPALLVRTRPPRETLPGPRVENQYVAEGSAGGVIAYVYRQSSREPDCGARHE